MFENVSSSWQPKVHKWIKQKCSRLHLIINKQAFGGCGFQFWFGKGQKLLKSNCESLKLCKLWMWKTNFSMTKFNVMQSNQVFMAWLGIYSNHSTKTSNEFFRSPKSYMIFGALTMCTVFFVMEIVSSSSNFTRKIDSVLVVVGMSEVICVFLNYGIKIPNMRALQLKLQSMVDKGRESEFLFEKKIILFF